MLQSRNIVQYFEDNPAVVNTIVTTVTHHTLLSTPAPTPRDDVSTPLPSQNNAQVYENRLHNAEGHTTHARQSPCVDDSYDTSLSDPHHRNPSALDGRRQYQAYWDDVEESETEHAGGTFLPVDNLEDSALADTDNWPEDPSPKQDGHPSQQAAQAVVTLISQQLEFAQYRPCKRKHAREGGETSTCDQSTALDEYDTELETLSPEVSGSYNPPSSPSGDDSSHGQEPYPLDESIPPAEGHGDFAILDEGWRAKVRMIADGETKENFWHVVNYMKAQSSPLARCSCASSYPALGALQSRTKESANSWVMLSKRMTRKRRSGLKHCFIG